MWFKKKNNKNSVVVDINDINNYIIKNYVPTEDESAPKRRFRKQTVDHITPKQEVRYQLRENVSFSVSDEKKDNIKYMLSFDDLGDIENLSAKQASEMFDDIVKESFSDVLMKHIIEKDIKNSVVYKTAQVDRKLFSKIISVRGYNPSKDTAISLAVALNLNLEETNFLISKAGYTLSNSRKKDLIIAYFINKKTYDIDTINDALFKLGESTLGRYWLSFSKRPIIKIYDL